MIIRFSNFKDLWDRVHLIKDIEQQRRDAIAVHMSKFGLSFPDGPFVSVYIDLANMPKSFDFKELDEISKPFDIMLQTLGVEK